MKKHFAVLLIAIMAVSVLSVTGVVTAKTINPGDKFPPIDIDPCSYVNRQTSPNPEPTNFPGWGTTVQVRAQVCPIVLSKSNQEIRVTILYNKKNFDPLMWKASSYTFGRRGTEAAPIAQSVSDVNHDGYKDLTLTFRAKDTGLKTGDHSGKLTGNIPNFICQPRCNCPAMVSRPLWVTATVPLLVL
jgi:hypothetical protein